VPTEPPALILVRHGETEWSKSGQHTGRTDLPLTDVGRRQARTAGDVVRTLLAGSEPAAVISSPRQRAQTTAELAGFRPTEIDPDAAEWDYGDYEGLTSSQIRQTDPSWQIWDGRVPGGEDAAQVQSRIDRLLGSARRHLGSGPVLIFSHGHASRCIAARWLDEPVSAGRRYRLGTGAVSGLDFEHGAPVILHWNLDESVIGVCPPDPKDEGRHE
jgi:broad specificity phosphatase PhoE